MCEMQTLEQMTDENFTCDVYVMRRRRRREEEDSGEKVNLQQHFCQHWRASALREILYAF
jgi:hypothetical protein